MCTNFSKLVLLFSWSPWLYSLLRVLFVLIRLANYNFCVISSNARGIRDFQKPDFAFLQEDTASLKVELNGSYNGEVKCFLPLALITEELLLF